MRLEINTLKKGLGTLSLGILLLLGTGISTQAQRRHGPPPWAAAYGRRYDRPYGQIVSARRHARNEARRDLFRSDRLERRALNERLRYERRTYGNNPALRYQIRQQRRDLRLQQRSDRDAFRQSWKVNSRGRH
ncbi:MAG TPA: hypothetical protein VF779_00015 [Pyrinomonadaceae bacterium]